MIKKPFNFVIGIVCLSCFVINIVNGRDMFTLIITALATVTNIFIGFAG